MYQSFVTASSSASKSPIQTVRARQSPTGSGRRGCRSLQAAVEAFEWLLACADRGVEGGVGLGADTATRIHDAFGWLARCLQVHAGAGATWDQADREELGACIREKLLPYLKRSNLTRRICEKPRGYAGDFLTIAKMYEGVATGIDAVGAVIDRAIRDEPACQAVINRRGVLAEAIERTRSDPGGAVVRVASLACGPAAELFDVFAGLEDPRAVAATCVDIDVAALEYVATRGLERGVRDCFDLHEANLVHLVSGRRVLDMPPQDLIYSIGLIDYFGDRFVVRLLDWVHDCLAPGGRAIFGNFHVNNPSRALMDHVLDWKLIHRTEADMHRLYRASKFGRGCTAIRFEDQGVNMFAECVKVAAS